MKRMTLTLAALALTLPALSPAVGQQFTTAAEVRPMTALCQKLDIHSSLPKSFSKWRSDSSPLGIDKKRLGVSETGMAIKAGRTRNRSRSHAQ